MTVKTQMPIVIFRGDNTAAFDLRTIRILLSGDLDLSHATAKFTLLDFSKTWTEQEVATGELSIAFTSEQTKAFALGPQTGTLRLYDTSTGTPRQLTIVNKIPFFVTNRVCEIDSQSYEADVCVSGGDVIHIEFKVGAGAVEGKADKVKNATAGDLASLTADGNLEDSGIPKADVLRKSQMDSTPTEGSRNPVTSDGIKRAIDAATPSDYAQVKAQVAANTGDIAEIESLIPAQASEQNKLADRNFVNSSIQTNTATFRGTYNLVSDLGLTVSATEQQVATAIAAKLASLVPPVVPENNDYVFVQVPKTDAEPTVIERVDRYKCTVTESGGVTTRTWEYEWSLNNSSFTADQWAAINSGVTAADVTKLAGIEAGAQVNAVTGVKGNAEQDYRTGNINLTPANIGAVEASFGFASNLTASNLSMAGSASATCDLIILSTQTFPPSQERRLVVRNALNQDAITQTAYYDGRIVRDGKTISLPSVAGTLALLQNLADDFSESTTYAIDNLCVYNGKLYKCTTAVTAAGAWDASKWTEATVQDVLAAIRSALDGKAPLASPAFTGEPTAPTPTAGDNSTKVATTAFVQGALPYAIASVPSGDALADRTVNTKTVNAATYAPSFPAETSGKSCDFYLAITSDTAGSVSAPSGKTLYNAKGESANLDYEANKTTVLRFTQIGANTYVVTGGANGGGSVDPATLNTKLDSEAAAPDYDSTATYAEGEYVTYLGKLYYAKQAITTPEAWTAAHWQETDMTSPDATLDITSQGSLRVVSAGGQTLWQQGYKLASASSATLSNEGVNIFTFAAVAAFDDTASYAIGDTVAYDGKAYAFTSAHSAGAWTGSDVELAAQSFSLPAAPTGKVGDFILEIDNTANASVDVAIDIAEYTNTTISLVIPDGAAIDDMTAIGGGVRCEFYFTQTAFNVNSKPTWKVVRQDVEVAS